jgi:hypothetical protein
MYQGPECTSDITTAEEYLLGKPIKDSKPEDKKHFTPVFQESYSNPQNEIFTKIHEDPLFSIKREEHTKRKEIEDNPYKMKLLLKEVEKNIKKRKKDKKEKKSKKHKKEKKSKKSHKNSSSSRSNSSSTEKASKYKTPDIGTLRITTPGLLNKSLNNAGNFGLVDKSGNKILSTNPSNRRISDIRPDETLYKERLKMLEKESELRRRRQSESSKTVKDLTNEERDIRIAEMEKKAHLLDYQKNLQSEEITLRLKQEETVKSSRLNKPEFIKNLEKDAYTEGKISLSDRVRRNMSTNMKHE